MEESSILLTFTQVAIAFVGFAAIVATFRFKDEFTIKKNDAVDLQLIINTGLVGAFFSILPLALSSFGLQDTTVWGLSSGIVSLNYLGFSHYLSKKIEISKIKRKKSKLIVVLYFSIGFLVLIMNLMNAFNILFLREFGPYFISLIYPLSMDGYMFTRLLFLPIWRTLKNQESSNHK